MGLLDVINLSHSFGDKILYQEASFELFKGEHMGIVGRNGTGKTTLLNTLIGEIIPMVGRFAGKRALRSDIWISMPRLIRRLRCLTI